MDEIENKKNIRKIMRERRRSISDAERRQAGHRIANRLEQSPLNLFLRTQVVCIYLSAPHEIPTHSIAQAAWRAGKTICVPAWDGEGYQTFLLTPKTPLVFGKFNIREPGVKIPVPLWEINAFILPGLAFDRNGGRLGYGGGFYDRMLAKSAPGTFRIAIGYDWQIQEESLPQETLDQPVDWIVTDKQTVRTIRPQ